ncbi:ferredoxin--NADP reductase [Oceanobacillus picturae]|uniref:Ferredoxin--NADP reductase n=1 Tax=Oceanobacillus picturae TaxID=171693 RepID=A0A0U9H4Q5_9BACI|nr:YpdA family putative bacillithiol disulfide reductase [Oceanobacillus picturae]RIU96155.1 YpdA family putative bacillithiol disulfide reductase [Oceanobacillus picturae]GAQ17471.1 ferredoxin--NADP reductase [Oceanobacillus picturae]
MPHEKVIIVGGGPCGLSCALELKKEGFSPLIIEKENIVNTIHQFPTHQTFFSSSEKLEIGNIPFITEKQKPVRNEALAYYRSVAMREELRINAFEKVTEITKGEGLFRLSTITGSDQINNYSADYVIIATGYYDQPNYMNIPGEKLNKVTHYFKEGHPYFNKDVVIIGGKNSAVDATLELHKAGANVTVLYRGAEYSKSIKPWILPEFDSLVRKEIVKMEFNANIVEITENSLRYRVGEEEKTIKNDFVFAMTGYKPDLDFLNSAGIHVDPATGSPSYKEDSYETNIDNLFIAGVVAAGYNNNKLFIENGRFHGGAIARTITGREE